MFPIDLLKLTEQLRYDPRNPLLFNNGFFLYFFAAFILLFYISRNNVKWRTWITCLFSLYFFYKASGLFVCWVIISAAFNFLFSNIIYRQQNPRFKKWFLWLNVACNLALLFYFKYTDFFISICNDFFKTGFNPLNLVLPIGISFFTFENISYTIDVYQDKFKPAKKFSDYLLFLSFFPKLVMGPIVRAADFIPQLSKPWYVSEADFSRGFYLIVAGLFKKLIISDYITLNLVNYIFDNPSMHSGLECLFALYGYAIVIYCDFSGYSDIAIGIALWLGIKIPPNFNLPYQSRNITEFWKRWHISLSSWLQDYLYIFALGGNRKKGWKGLTWIGNGFLKLFSYLRLKPLGNLFAKLFNILGFGSKGNLRTYFNLMVTMVLGGLWHGPSWNFIIWGALHGVALIIHKLWMNWLPSDKKGQASFPGTIISWFITFQWVCLCWIFFKAATLNDSVIFIRQIFANFGAATFPKFVQNYGSVLLMILIGYVIHAFPKRWSDVCCEKLQKAPLAFFIVIFVAGIFLYLQFRSATPVLPIYLQF